MRKIGFLVAAAACFGLAPFAGRLGVVAGSALLLVLALALSAAASGAFDAISLAGGALGAFASVVLSGVSPAVGGAALVALAFAERSLRVRGQTARLVHAGAALGAGALAGALTSAYGSASPAVRGVAVVVAAVVVALPLLIDADDPVAHALDSAADDVAEPARASLREAAELRRTAGDDLLDRRSARQVRATWRALLRLAEARLRLERRGSAPRSAHAGGVMARVDQRIADYVGVLTRAYVALDTAHAAEASLDDAAMRSVETVGESLEQVTSAIVEEV